MSGYALSNEPMSKDAWQKWHKAYGQSPLLLNKISKLVHWEALTNMESYYPFGMGMPWRVSAGDYRYGFQGQEGDNEITGSAISAKRSNTLSVSESKYI